ncbi:MAG: hypothetical protein K8R79_07025, partial [Calditrichales bacterium]|nr:hypothetical protein [Calditrichales bacterium]
CAVADKFDIDEGESSNVANLAVSIEFALDAKHNNYLAILGDCEAAIVGLKALKYAEFYLKDEFEPDFEVSFEGDKVRVEFTKVIYKIKRS